MAWPDQNPPASDVILNVNVPCSGGAPAYMEIDKLPDGTYWAEQGGPDLASRADPRLFGTMVPQAAKTALPS